MNIVEVTTTLHIESDLPPELLAQQVEKSVAVLFGPTAKAWRDPLQYKGSIVRVFDETGDYVTES